MSNTSSRALRLLSLLQTQRRWSGFELAERLEVSERTIRRDIDRLRELGYPVDAQRGVDGGYALATGSALPPLLLDDDEAVALSVGLQAGIQTGSVVGIAESSVRVLAKLVEALPSRVREQVEALAASTLPAVWDAPERVEPGVLTAVGRACRDTVRLRFGYVAGTGDRSDRQVEPHRLVLLGHRWYLVAWDLGRFDWRSFRLDRVTTPIERGPAFGPRQLPAKDAATFVRSALDDLRSEFHVDAIIDAAAPAVRAIVGKWGAVDEIDGDRCRLQMRSGSLDWPAMVLGSTGAPFSVLAPPELVEHLRSCADRFADAARRSTDEVVVSAVGATVSGRRSPTSAPP